MQSQPINFSLNLMPIAMVSSNTKYRSPIEDIKGVMIFWKVFAIFTIETDSKVLQWSYYLYVAISHTFCIYIGFVMQFGACFKANSLKDVVETLFISFAYANAVFKVTIMHFRRNDAKKLWRKLNKDHFKIKDSTEQV